MGRVNLTKMTNTLLALGEFAFKLEAKRGSNVNYWPIAFEEVSISFFFPEMLSSLPQVSVSPLETVVCVGPVLS